MSDDDDDDDEPQLIISSAKSDNEAYKRRLSEIKGKIHGLTREKTKYNLEKLTSDIDFLQNENYRFKCLINDAHREIIEQISIKKILNTKIAILRSSAHHPYPTLQIALRDKGRYEKECEKTDKMDSYRQLARERVNSIDEALPQLEEIDKYNKQLQEAENTQRELRIKRQEYIDKFELNARKQNEKKHLRQESSIKLPQIESEIECLRLERETLLKPKTTKKKNSLSSPQELSPSYEQNMELKSCDELLNKIQILLKYFREKLAEHNLTENDLNNPTPAAELTAPLFHPITPIDNKVDSISSQNNSNNKPIIVIAMKLPRNFIPLDFNSVTTINNEIVRSPNCEEKCVQYKKELPADIIDKYSGTIKHKQEVFGHQRKTKKHRKKFAIKHSSQMIALYNDVCKTSGKLNIFPSVPMYIQEILPAVQALRLFEQNIELNFNKLSKRKQSVSEQCSSNIEEDYVEDSAVEIHSETSSLIEVNNHPINPTVNSLKSKNAPETNSSSSSDDKKTVISVSTNQNHQSFDQHLLRNVPLTTVEELPLHTLPVSFQTAQIDRQVSDEGYRSVKSDVQPTVAATLSLLNRSQSYDSAEKVDKWLSRTIVPLSISLADNNSSVDMGNYFQGTESNDENET